MSTHESHVVTSVAVEIDAPAELVWEVLVDYPRYPEWNPYTIAAETTLQIGDPIDLTLPAYDGSGGTFITREYIRLVEAPHHLRYDSGEEFPGVVGVRDQWITPLGSRRCSYRTADTLSGAHAGLAMDMTGSWMQEGFDAVAHALKTRAERVWAHQS